MFFFNSNVFSLPVSEIDCIWPKIIIVFSSLALGLYVCMTFSFSSLWRLVKVSKDHFASEHIPVCSFCLLMRVCVVSSLLVTVVCSKTAVATELLPSQSAFLSDFQFCEINSCPAPSLGECVCVCVDCHHFDFFGFGCPYTQFYFKFFRFLISKHLGYQTGF